MMQATIKKVETQKAYQLSATFYEPSKEIAGAVLIVPGMGISQQYYAPLAEWLAEQGFMVATFDYYGTGLSQTESLRNTQATISQWAKVDCSSMLKAVSSEVPDKPLYWIGHSLGGQILGLVPNFSLVSKAVTIASGSGYWRQNAPQLKRRAWLLWYIVAPLSMALYGYFPGKRLGMVGDLPKGVMRQWQQWCLDPEYVMGVESREVGEQYQGVTAPICSFSFTDDEFMSVRNIESLHGFYSAAKITMHRLAPEDVGVSRIGHFGFFKDRFKQTLWRDYLLLELN